MGFEKPPTFSAIQPLSSEEKGRLALAMERCAMMLDSYPDRADVPNAGVYVGTLAQILASYPESVINAVTHPTRGLQTRCTFRPKPAEVRAACDAEMAPIIREDERRMRLGETRKMLAAPSIPRAARPSIEDIKAKLGPDYGIERTGARPKEPGKTLAELKAEAATWDIEVSSELISNIAEKSAQNAGEA
jgi:hypothetical protein